MSGAVLILGATSAIAKATAAAFAAKGHPLYLAGRDDNELERIAADIAIRYGVTVEYGLFDADSAAEHGKFLDQVIGSVGELEGTVLAFGYLGEQSVAAADGNEQAAIIQRNFTGAASILALIANYLEPRKRGFIIGISSVAGDRGRQSNYTYGAAKGALSLFLQGMRNRLFPAGVKVLTVKPGFVDTAMTFGLPGMFLVASPESTGKQIVSSLEKGKDVVYLPWFWRYIMLIIRSIPERIFKRLSL